MRSKVSGLWSDNKERATREPPLVERTSAWLTVPRGRCYLQSLAGGGARVTSPGKPGGNRDLLAQGTWFIQRHLLYRAS